MIGVDDIMDEMSTELGRLRLDVVKLKADNAEMLVLLRPAKCPYEGTDAHNYYGPCEWCHRTEEIIKKVEGNDA